MHMRVVNVDRLHSLPGCGPFEEDFSVVLSTTETVPHPISGQAQPKRLYSGTLKECHEWVRQQSAGPNRSHD